MRLEKNPLVRAVPLEIKKYFLMVGAEIGSRSITAVYSNIGIVRFPEEYQKFIERFGILQARILCRCVPVPMEMQMTLGFTSEIPINSIERNFLRMLKEEEISCREERNDFPAVQKPESW